jgi:hypothetical protein
VSNIAKRGAPNQPAKTPTVEGDRYTVLLLDEDQLDRFLSKPRFKSLGSHLGRTVDVWPRAHRLKSWGAVAAVVLVAVTAVVWLRAAGGDTRATTTSRAYRPVDAAPIPTGASFSVQVTSFARDADARVMAGRLTKAGLPSFAWRLDGSLRDVLVGPFVSIDEAEAAQREVARLGFARTRLHVDERLRATNDAVVANVSDKSNPVVVLVAAPGRLAVVFELEGEPQQVSGQRIDAATFAVTTSALGTPMESQEWNAASDVQLVKHVSVTADSQGTRGLDARVIVAENAVATVRVEGSRVYVDVSRAQLDFDERAVPGAPAAPAPRASAPVAAAPRVEERQAPARSARVGVGPSAAPPTPAAPQVGAGPRGQASSPSGDVTQYRQAIGPIFARFEEIQPFLRSAVATPTPEVLAAIAGTFAELEDALRATDVPRNAQAAHGLMTSAVQLARGAVAPSFFGDRTAQVREAMAQFQAAKAQLR